MQDWAFWDYFICDHLIKSQNISTSVSFVLIYMYIYIYNETLNFIKFSIKMLQYSFKDVPLLAADITTNSKNN